MFEFANVAEIVFAKSMMATRTGALLSTGLRPGQVVQRGLELILPPLPQQCRVPLLRRSAPPAIVDHGSAAPLASAGLGGTAWGTRSGLLAEFRLHDSSWDVGLSSMPLESLVCVCLPHLLSAGCPLLYVLPPGRKTADGGRRRRAACGPSCSPSWRSAALGPSRCVHQPPLCSRAPEQLPRLGPRLHPHLDGHLLLGRPYGPLCTSPL